MFDNNYNWVLNFPWRFVCNNLFAPLWYQAFIKEIILDKIQLKIISGYGIIDFLLYMVNNNALAL